MHIKDGSKRMTSIRLQVTPIPILCRPVQIVILPDELLQLRLDIIDAFGREIEFHQRHASFLEVFEESDFRRLKEHETSAFAVGTPRCASDAVNVVSWVVGGIYL